MGLRLTSEFETPNMSARPQEPSDEVQKANAGLHEVIKSLSIASASTRRVTLAKLVPIHSLAGSVATLKCAGKIFASRTTPWIFSVGALHSNRHDVDARPTLTCWRSFRRAGPGVGASRIVVKSCTASCPAKPVVCRRQPCASHALPKTLEEPARVGERQSLNGVRRLHRRRDVRTVVESADCMNRLHAGMRRIAPCRILRVKDKSQRHSEAVGRESRVFTSATPPVESTERSYRRRLHWGTPKRMVALLDKRNDQGIARFFRVKTQAWSPGRRTPWEKGPP